MKVSQHIQAGRLTSFYVSGWSEEMTLNFGEDQIKFTLDETLLREMQSDIADRIKTIDEDRAAEIKKQCQFLGEKEQDD